MPRRNDGSPKWFDHNESGTPVEAGISGPVTCLGLTFENDEARRAHFTKELRQKLQDPEFRKIEGFPIGTDEAILNLSDPPYYTACPNPWLADFITEWEVAKPEKPADYKYHREPFAADVSEGKNDPIYNAHSYHTKVPHKAIMRYILHYTEPGDIVLDGFCGTGMTGVAAQLCGNLRQIESLGYQVKNGTTIIGSDGQEISIIGKRHSIIADLSPLATFIAYNINYPISGVKFNRIYRCLKNDIGHYEDELYSTFSDDGRKCGTINYVIWSDSYCCAECANEYLYWDLGVDLNLGETKKKFLCSNCGAEQSTRSLTRTYETCIDPLTNAHTRLFKQCPVRVSYISFDSKKLQKAWNKFDNDLILSIMPNKATNPYFPIAELPKGDRWRRDAFDDKGVTHIHHFYTSRNIVALSIILRSINEINFDYRAKMALLFLFTSFSDRNATKRNRFIINKHNPHGRVNGPMANCLYLPNLFCEMNIFRLMDEKQKDILAAFNSYHSTNHGKTAINTGSSTQLKKIPDASIDYIFTDPPFGHNIQYSELNYALETFIEVNSNNGDDIVVNDFVGKTLSAYSDSLYKTFTEYYRVLKPGKWITVEFHNSKASVWNAIQEAMGKAGFIVAHIATLDKKQKTVHQDTNVNGTVDQDLIISAYKANGGLEDRFTLVAGTENGVWDFIRSHLARLPLCSLNAGKMEIVSERTQYLLFDRMVAFHIRRGATIPISAAEFYLALIQRFPERDGMFFLPEQIEQYVKKRASVKSIEQYEMFIYDEATAIQWLRQLLKAKPQTFQGVYPDFMREISGWKKSEVSIDLLALLDLNFLKYDGKGQVPEQIHAYLSSNWKDHRNRSKDDPELQAKAKDRWYVPDPNKASDLEQLREKALLKEFEEYKTSTKKQLKPFRSEAVRAGFKKAWQERDYATVVAIAKKIPSSDLEEDPKLLMWYDQALTRIGGE